MPSAWLRLPECQVNNCELEEKPSSCPVWAGAASSRLSQQAAEDGSLRCADSSALGVLHRRRRWGDQRRGTVGVRAV